MSVNGVSVTSNDVSGTLAGQESVSGTVGGSYELSPALSAQQTVRGNLSRLKTMRGYSAFEVAVINGFRGTVEEWLESLKGEPGYTPVKGADYYTEADKAEMVASVIASLPVYNGEVQYE